MVTLTVLLTLAITVGVITLAFIGVIAIPLIDIGIAIGAIWMFVTIISFIGGLIFGHKDEAPKKPSRKKGPK